MKFSLSLANRLIWIEGCLALLVTAFLPVSEQAVEYGFWPVRGLPLIAGILLVGALLFIDLVGFLREKQVNRKGETCNYLLWLVVFCAFLGWGAVTLVLFSKWGRWLGVWQGIAYTAWPLVLWAGLGMLEWLVAFTVENKARFFSISTWNSKPVYQTVLVLITVSVTVVHWIILFYCLPVFDIIPGWFWKFSFKPFSPRDLVFALLAALFLLFFWWAMKGGFSRGKVLLVLFAAGTAFQFSFGFLDGQGVESLRLKYVNSSHKNYAEHAADRPDLWEALTDYNNQYGREIYLGTKPPGVLLVYALMQKASALLFSVTTYKSRFNALTTLIAWIFPFISMLVLFPLYSLKNNLRKGGDDLIPAFLYVVCPNVVLIPLFLDQALYPLLFTACLLVWWQAIRRDSIRLAFVSGFLAYLSMYFTFSMLPLVPLMVLWLVLEYWQKRKLFKTRRWAGMLGSALLGLGAAYLILRFGLNYDIWQRYLQAMERHRSIKIFQPGIQFMLQSFFLNTVDLAAWSGFALSITFLIGLGSALFHFFRRQADAVDTLLTAWFLMYIFLNVFGQTRGEVGRLWIFMLPLICLGATQALQRWFENRRVWGVLALLSMQLMTTWLMFHYQDFFA